MNKKILASYRIEGYDKELVPVLEKYAGDDITVLCSTPFQRKGLRYFDTEKRINKIVTIDELLAGELDNMKFDVIVGNPPYQKIVGPNKTQQIWADLTVKFYDLLKPYGEMNLIHPPGWRFTSSGSMKNVKKIKEIYSTNKITYMEFNDYTKGKETFGAMTDYDIVHLKKESVDGLTTIKTKTDGLIEVDLGDFNVIPTDNFELFGKLRAKNGEEKVQVLYSRSDYGSDKKNVKNQQDSEFKYPCVYGMPKKGLKLLYSNTNKNGHFGIPKLIFTKAGIGSILDLDGKYGLTQYAFGIVDSPENLIKIQKVLEDYNIRRKFHMMVGIQVAGYGDGVKSIAIIIKEFRKDFWKDFIND